MKQLLIIMLAMVSVTVHAQVEITIDSDTPGVDISPMLYGIFYEDINHAADGGIYAELIRNRAFEDSTDGDNSEIEAWKPYLSVNGNVALSLETKNLINDVQKHCLHVTTTNIGDTDAGVMNEGFWGINAVKGRTYQLSLWIKVKKGSDFYAIIKGQTGTHLYGSAKLDVSTKSKSWQHISTTITTDSNDKDAIFAITSKGNSEFYLDVVSLFPPTYKNHPNGLRSDLVEMLYELHPRFMRFPGGCFVEGMETSENAFHWERTIGAIEERPGHENKNWGYRTTDGLGYHEYLQLAEDLHALPLYVCNIGIWHGGVTPLDELQPWVDECLGAIEYANGGVDTKYGALRAANGHPASFNLKYIEIGNENNQEDKTDQRSDQYYERYRIFRDAILEKYPEMIIIGDVAAWGTDDPRWEVTDAVDLVDEHYYRTPLWFTSNFKKYDSYDRSWPAVYCGEYAVTNGFGNLGNLDAALGEAVFMMGFENNSDIVKMSSYAPIFVNENDARWKPDMVRFNSETVMGTPSYYVQKLFADNLGTKTLAVTQGDEIQIPVKILFTPRESNIGIATFNTQSTFKDLTITANNHTTTIDNDSNRDFLPASHSWQFTKDGISQTDNERGIPALVAKPVMTRKYSASVTAKKNGGEDGFILVFNYEDKNNYCWLTLGGRGNTVHRIERCVNGNRTAVVTIDGSVEEGRWYDVRVEVDDNDITAYLDGEKILETTLTGTTLPGIYTSASIDEKSNEMIIKIVNTSSVKESATLNLGSFRTSGGTLTQLRAADGKAENTLHNPTNVYPTTKAIYLDSDNPQVDIQPFSLNILRLKKD